MERPTEIGDPHNATHFYTPRPVVSKKKPRNMSFTAVFVHFPGVSSSRHKKRLRAFNGRSQMLSVVNSRLDLGAQDGGMSSLAEGRFVAEPK